MSIAFSPATFSADEDCRWDAPETPGLRMNEHYIAAPKLGEDRAAWLAAMKAYRLAVREDGTAPVVAMDYKGTRAWIRMAAPVAKAYAFAPGEKVRVRIDARRIQGNRELCLAFDLHRTGDDAKTGWSGVVTTLQLPDDDDWHVVQTDVAIPAFDATTAWLRPIVGMDATHDATKGRVQIRGIALTIEDAARMRAAQKAAEVAPRPRLDLGCYDKPEFAWMQRAFTCHFTFLYDASIYDAKAGCYRLKEFLDEAERAFGGYDAMVLWHAYPRLGFDDRNQFDMYRDMPGGLERLRGLVREAHARNVRVFIDYNPWDTGTRREGRPDEDLLADIVGAIEADGIFLDTMVAGSPALRLKVDAARTGVVFEPEGHPPVEQLGICNASWAQGLTDPEPPGILRLKWIEPRHMQHQIRRWNDSHRDEIASAFFNGSGMLIWENVFGTYNPWIAEDAATWKRAAAILRAYASLFVSDAWEPFAPTLHPTLYANRWPGDGVAVYTLLNTGEPFDGDWLDVPAKPNAQCYDLWNGKRIDSPLDGGQRGVRRITGHIDRLACIATIEPPHIDNALEALLKRQQTIDIRSAPPRKSTICNLQSTIRNRLILHPSSFALQSMLRIPGATFNMHIDHIRRECGCYPDPGTPPDRQREFLWGFPFDQPMHHRIANVSVKSFLIDEAEVTNAEYKHFVDETHYRPVHPENFLKHWPNGVMPPELADHPVVYVDLDDARAYARWAGKRLPTEPEWHLAAQGTDGRTWPWGNEFDPAKCNSGGEGTKPARSYPEGRGPYGCYNMSGNVWEWTDAVYDDGHTRFAILRGGSCYKAQGSIWYADGGPQPCNHHAKFILMWPGLDRCATIGLRCAADL